MFSTKVFEIDVNALLKDITKKILMGFFWKSFDKNIKIFYIIDVLCFYMYSILQEYFKFIWHILELML